MKIGQRVVEVVIKGVDQTSAAFGNVSKKIGEWSKEFPALAMLAGISLGQIANKVGELVGAIGRAIQENIKLGASFDDMSKRTDLSVETLTKWGYIARMNGATTEEFEAALRKLRQTMADAISGNEAAIKTFATLGVKVTDANGEMRDLESVLLEIGQVIREFGTASLQGAAAQEALGRGSASMVAVIRQSRQELEMAAREAEVFTGNMGTGWAEAAAAADDAAERMKIAVDNIKAQFSASLMGNISTGATAVLLQLFDRDTWKKLLDLEYERYKMAGTQAAEAYVQGLYGGLAGGVGASESVTGPAAQAEAQRLAALTAEINRLVKTIPPVEIPAKIVSPEDTGIASRFGEGADEANLLLEEIQALEDAANNLAAAPLPAFVDPAKIAEGDAALERLLESMREMEFNQQAADDAARSLAAGLGSVASQAGTAFLMGTSSGMKFGNMIREVITRAVMDLIVQLTIVKGLMKLFALPFAQGGTVPGMALGGRIPRAAMGYAVPDGPRGMDSRLIMAMPGEEVINRSLSRRLDRFIAAYETGAAVSPFSLAGAGGGRGAAVINFNVGRPVSVLDALDLGRNAVTAARKYSEAAL